LLSGFSTTALPAISAGTASEIPVANGKFHGAMMPTTPLGRRISVDVVSSGTGPPRRVEVSSRGARFR
jgi:hypothetical protein